MVNYILTSGIGHGDFKLTSFDDALISSGVFNYNLVKVSSILPAHATLKDRIELKRALYFLLLTLRFHRILKESNWLLPLQ